MLKFTIHTKDGLVGVTISREVSSYSIVDKTITVQRSRLVPNITDTRLMWIYWSETYDNVSNVRSE